MDLLLSFDEFCKISDAFKGKFDLFEQNNHVSRLNVLINNANALRVKALFMIDPKQTNAIVNLINQCNLEMIDELMKYFDEFAPIQKLLENRRQELCQEKQKKMETVINTRKYSVYDVLIEEMKIKGYETDANLYNYIDMDRRIFSKFRREEATISRENALWFAAGFELSYPEAVEFLAKLGYAFKVSDVREQLIAYVMRTRTYKFCEIQSILFHFGFRTFGEVKE